MVMLGYEIAKAVILSLRHEIAGQWLQQRWGTRLQNLDFDNDEI